MKKEIRYIINWHASNSIEPFNVFYNSFEEANTKRLQISTKEGKILKVIIELPKGNKNGKETS